MTVALATLLDNAGVSWGILGKDEKCCGDSLRRLGNEYVFDRMARENVALFKERGVKKIITQCPHCFSTLKNDYRQYGLELEVVHHSELLRNLIRDGTTQAQDQTAETWARSYSTTPATWDGTTKSTTPRAQVMSMRHRQAPGGDGAQPRTTPSAAAPAAAACGWRRPLASAST